MGQTRAAVGAGGPSCVESEIELNLKIVSNGVLFSSVCIAECPPPPSRQSDKGTGKIKRGEELRYTILNVFFISRIPLFSHRFVLYFLKVDGNEK
jgi:hypothetical protein